MAFTSNTNYGVEQDDVYGDPGNQQFRNDSPPPQTTGQPFNPGNTTPAASAAPARGTPLAAGSFYGSARNDAAALGATGVAPVRSPAPMPANAFQNRRPARAPGASGLTAGTFGGASIGPSSMTTPGAVRVLGAGTYGMPSTGAGAAASTPLWAGNQQRPVFGATSGSTALGNAVYQNLTTPQPAQATDFGGAVNVAPTPSFGARPTTSPAPIMSDERNKMSRRADGDDVERLGKSPVSETLGNMHPYTYEYKEPDKWGHGPRLGVMAQDIEKSPMGAQVVRDTPEGKVIDGPKGLSLALAGAANHEQRIRDIESRLGARRGK